MTKRRAIITGAAGGMGRACARLLGTTQALVLADVAAPALEAFANELRHEGYEVAGVHAGDLGGEDVLSGIAGHVSADVPFTLIHTAGLSPSFAGWEKIMDVNLIATEKLLRAIEPSLSPGSVAVLIASSAGHMMPRVAEADAIMADPLAADFWPRITAAVEDMAAQVPVAGLAGISYTFSKQAVLTICEQRSISWGKKGARIVSISPGMIATPMGRKEAETPAGAAVAESAPAGRTGTAIDIALAARFLASEEASFISGCDLKVDGAVVAAMGHAMKAA